jgi:transposase
MKEKLRFLGLDVHAETIAVAESDGEVRSLGTIPNRLESIRKLIKKLGLAEKLRACYEARADWPCSVLAVGGAGR